MYTIIALAGAYYFGANVSSERASMDGLWSLYPDGSSSSMMVTSAIGMS